MSGVFESVAFGSSWRQGQHWIESVERLNGRFLINAEDGGMTGWVQLQTDDVGGFAFEVRIVRGHIALQAVRRQSSLFPQPMDDVFADAERLSQFASTPVGRAIGGFLTCSRQNFRTQCRCQNRWWLAGMICVQSINTSGDEAFFPAAESRCGGLQPFFDLAVRAAFRQHEDQLGSKNIPGG